MPENSALSEEPVLVRLVARKCELPSLNTFWDPPTLPLSWNRFKNINLNGKKAFLRFMLPSQNTKLVFFPEMHRCFVKYPV